MVEFNAYWGTLSKETQCRYEEEARELEFVVEGLTGNVEAWRLQIPLALSWAMSVHKSQGQTLSRVKVDLARIFEKGQGE